VSASKEETRGRCGGGWAVVVGVEGRVYVGKVVGCGGGRCRVWGGRGPVLPPPVLPACPPPTVLMGNRGWDIGAFALCERRARRASFAFSFVPQCDSASCVFAAREVSPGDFCFRSPAARHARHAYEKILIHLNERAVREDHTR